MTPSLLSHDAAKEALDSIADGLGTGPHASAVSDWFVSATLFKQTIDSLFTLGIGYDKLLRGVSFILGMIKQYGPDLATIVHNIVEQGQAILNPQG